jgi:hypothetical protein
MKNNTSVYSNTINVEAPDMGCFEWVLKKQDISCLTCTNTDTNASGSPCMGCGEYSNWEAQHVVSKAS